MKQLSKPNLCLALVHYPVINKEGNTIASAVTNLDLHDIARAAKTYGVKKFYIVTPLEDQLDLVNKILIHWTNGGGAKYNVLRKEALDLVSVKKTLADVLADMGQSGAGTPKTIMTCAKNALGRTGFNTVKTLLNTGEPYLLVFGTAWGLADELMAKADFILEPVAGNTGYNHLSVRSAAAIIIDRLLSDQKTADNF